MFGWAIAFLFIALLAGLLGVTGIASGAATIAKTVVFVAVVVAVVGAIIAASRRR
jgi:uncharacterized membrane protein YtjA (UPF0391 family)